MTKFLVLSLSLLSLSANSAYLVKKTIKNNKENIISVKEIDLKIRKIICILYKGIETSF